MRSQVSAVPKRRQHCVAAMTYCNLALTRRVTTVMTRSWEIAIDVPDFGPINVDVAYGGNYYAIVEPQGPYRGLDALGAARILALSPVVRRLVH
jgi:proline racemase